MSRSARSPQSHFYFRPLAVTLLLAVSFAPGCTTEDEADEAEDTGAPASEDVVEPRYTYWKDAKGILDEACVSCHRAGDIAPFPLNTFAEVSAVAAILPTALESGSMPPWPPAAGCNEYAHDRSLAPDQLNILLDWLADGSPEGDPADAPPPAQEPAAFHEDALLSMTEAYTPTQEPDDYRCFVIPWNETEPRYVTDFEFRPGVREIVHHVIATVVEPDNVEQLDAMDAADAGPGYTCFGGPGIRGRQLASWVPGVGVVEYPAGHGVLVNPGSKVVVQMHYNTLSLAPQADRSAIALRLAEAVERPLTVLPLADIGWITGANPMTIPAGEAKVVHSVRMDLDYPVVTRLLAAIGGQPGDPILIHQVPAHMHTLGRQIRISVHRSTGRDECLLSIDDWDFNWQGGYFLREPVEVGPGDSLDLTCTWDNSAANQPIIDGKLATPIDVEWGEGTRDEMCLSGLLVSRK